jgi:hypothetical protein
MGLLEMKETPAIGFSVRKWPGVRLDGMNNTPLFGSEQAVRGGVSRGTIGFMPIVLFAMHVLELMFFVGLVGSSVVVLISFVEDGKELFGKDED